jgi:hypothetical protein
LDTEQRQLGAAIILYGNNTVLRRELLNKYHVKFLYWDAFWLESEYRFDVEQRRFIGWFDPLVVHDTSENRFLLSSYGINYFAEHTWLDPTVHEPLPKEDLLFILPSRLDYGKPWHPDLENYLVGAWNYSENNITISRIFEVKT